MIKISALVLTLNEERRIRRTLESLDFCDEIVIVDSGSTDATVQICKTHNCRIFTRTLDSFSAQRKYALTCASNDWVFIIDADEVATDGLRREIAALSPAGVADINGFYVPRTLIFLGKRLCFGAGEKNSQLRLFKRNVAVYTDDKVHEKPSVPGKTCSLENLILHYSYDSIQDYFEKFNRYTTAAAQTLLEQNKKTSALGVALRLPLAFFKIYVVKGGFLDGYAGFVWSLLSSLYPVVKYAKLRELRRAAQDR